jgi:replicative superfamily II helicase
MRGIDESLLKVIKALGVKEFNEVQQLAAKKGVFETSDSYALVSHSRTGKTFIGTLFVANEMFKAQKDDACDETKDDVRNDLAIFIAPFHASARETSANLSKHFGWFLRPFVILGEARESEVILRLEKGLSPNVIIATPDAFQDMLRMDETREWLQSRTIRTVVYDDVHSVIHNPVRAMSLYETASFLSKKVEPKPRILVLSARFDGSKILKQVFNVKIINDDTEYKPPKISVKSYKKPEDKRTKLRTQVQKLADDGDRALVYMKTISDITQFLQDHGHDLANSVSYDIEPIIRERLTKLGEVLGALDYNGSTLVKSGVGCYHGQMTEPQRWFIEWANRRRYLRMVFGTDALAYGVSTPVSHVVMESPGIDEVFRQSMMARSVNVRRGRYRPGRCTVYSATLTDKDKYLKVYDTPSMPQRFLGYNTISNSLLGLIGLGLLETEVDRKTISKTLGKLFKKSSTSKILKDMQTAEPPLVKEDKGKLTLTPLGEIAFKNNVSGWQSRRIIEAIETLASKKSIPTEFDLLLILDFAGSLRNMTGKKKEMHDDLQQFYTDSVDSSLKHVIIDTDREKSWGKSVQRAVQVYTNLREDIQFESKSRKSVERIKSEMQMFSLNFKGFIEDMQQSRVLGKSKEIDNVLKTLLKLMDIELFDGLVLEQVDADKHSLRFKDLSFVDFDDIERSIDETLVSDLDPYQKMQLLGLLDSVEATTSSLVDLMTRSQDDPESREALEIVCECSKEGRVGSNVIKALEKEGIIQPGTVGQLWNQFSSRIEQIHRKTGAPAKAASIVLSVFTGDLIGASRTGARTLKMAFSRFRNVDVRSVS